MTVYVLREATERLYVVAATPSRDEPKIRREWFPTGQFVVPMSHLLLALVGRKLVLVRPGEFEVASTSWRVKLRDGFATKAERVDEVPVPRPDTRRSGLIVWSNGVWYVEGLRGREYLDEADVLGAARV